MYYKIILLDHIYEIMFITDFSRHYLCVNCSYKCDIFKLMFELT